MGFRISGYINSSLVGFPNIRLVERQQLSEILNEQRFQPSGHTDYTTLVAIGSLLNAEKMLPGSVYIYYTANGTHVLSHPIETDCSSCVTPKEKNIMVSGKTLYALDLKVILEIYYLFI